MANIVSIDERRWETIGADVDRYVIGKHVSELIEFLHDLHNSRGDEVFDHAARDLIAATAALLAHVRGYRRALQVLDTVRAANDPRSPHHWRRQRPIS